ncbi:uncharacterized protein CPUR_03559 [Claviceps purpurea 20.1]|uniref:Uncharacterized protein n=1 Tax=Claviceps purpurea (strain 20.1) TaxID=1111077 RepID=M1VVL1_CLAP2|nr:uncharacterized protein CPUR_03559 [Claviceps purpurea 20.1]
MDRSRYWKLKSTRFHEYNLEERTVTGADLFRIRYYKTMTEASKALRVPYKRLRSRVQGHQPVKANGGQTRRERSILSKVPLTPSVIRIFSKARKTGHSLALNGITATREMRLIEEKALARTNRHAQTAVIGKLGPLSMRDARLRVAKYQYSRRAAQKEEKERIFKRNTRQEMVSLCRWVAKVRLKAYLDNTFYISQHYDLLREMCAAEKAAAEDSAALDSAFLEDPAVTAAKAHKLSYNVSHNANVML